MKELGGCSRTVKVQTRQEGPGSWRRRGWPGPEYFRTWSVLWWRKRPWSHSASGSKSPHGGTACFPVWWWMRQSQATEKASRGCPGQWGGCLWSIRSLGQWWSETACLCFALTEPAVVEVAPSFSSALKDCTVVEGQDFVLQCSVKGTPLPRITWLLNGETPCSSLLSLWPCLNSCLASPYITLNHLCMRKKHGV